MSETNERWIFQDIKDLESKMYDEAKEAQSYIGPRFRFRQRLRNQIDPELYVRYLIWKCDIYVDSVLIEVQMKEAYPQISTKQISDWLDQHKGEDQYLI